MKTADIEIEDMAVAGNVVLKRTARVAVEHGTENGTSEHNGMKHNNHNNHTNAVIKNDESRSLTQNVESSKASTSGVITAMEGPAKKAYSRRGSASGSTRNSIEQATDTGRSENTNFDFDSPTLFDDESESSSTITTASLKTYKLDGLHEDDRPINFGQVIPGVYRSSFPKTDDYPFFRKLGLKTVV